VTKIRPARPEDAGFIAKIILSAQRGPRPRGWFDIALDRPEPESDHGRGGFPSLCARD